MKKVLNNLFMIIILLAVVLSLTGCKAKLKEVTLTTEDDDKKISATLGYSEKDEINVRDGYDESGKIFENEKEKWELEIYVVADTTYDDNKEYAEEEEGYKEIEFNGYKGYIYNDSETEIEGAILFDEGADDNVSKYLSIELSSTDYANDVDMSTIYQLDAVQTILKSIKYNGTETVASTDTEDTNTKPAGEFADRTDGIADKDGQIFIPSFESPKPELYKAEQRNDNIGIDNYLWYTPENRTYDASSIEVRIIPKSGTFESMEEYIEDKGDLYHFSKETIAGKEYDVYTFGDSTPIEKFSKNISGAFMVGNRVVEFHYNMYAEVPDQDLGDTFFNQIMDSVEYSKDFK